MENIKVGMDSRGKILVVDDDLSQTLWVKAILNLNGYDVQVANDGDVGLEKLLKDESIDAVLTDFRMPNMDGIEFFSEAKNKGLQTPFIFLSADDTKRISERVSVVNEGAYWLRKPLNADDLIYMINRLVSLTSKKSFNTLPEKNEQLLVLADYHSLLEERPKLLRVLTENYNTLFCDGTPQGMLESLRTNEIGVCVIPKNVPKIKRRTLSNYASEYYDAVPIVVEVEDETEASFNKFDNVGSNYFTLDDTDDLKRSISKGIEERKSILSMPKYRTGGRLFVIAGAPNTGKSTIMKIYLRMNPLVKEGIVWTGRGKRAGEIPGIDKQFTTSEYILSNGDDFIWTTHFQGHVFGYKKSEIDHYLNQGVDVILSAANPEIYQKLKSEYPLFDSTLLLTPPSELEESSKKRDKDPISPEIADRVYNEFLDIRDRFTRTIPNYRHIFGLENPEAKELNLANIGRSLCDRIIVKYH